MIKPYQKSRSSVIGFFAFRAFPSPKVERGSRSQLYQENTMNQTSKNATFGTAIFTDCPANKEELKRLANDMLAVWPKEFVLRREIPLFTHFLLSHADLKRMDALEKGPNPNFEIEGEYVYNKDTLAAWYTSCGYLGENIGGHQSDYLVPGCWFSEGRPSPDLNPYEVMLHRYAESGCSYAMAQVDITVKWDAPFTAICDIEEFCGGLVNEATFMRLLDLSLNDAQELPDNDSLYEKWELAFFLYNLARSTPDTKLFISQDQVSFKGSSGESARVGSIVAGYEKLAERLKTSVNELKKRSNLSNELFAQLDDDELAAAMDVRRTALKLETGERDVFDHYEFQTWLQYIVATIPMPIKLE